YSKISSAFWVSSSVNLSAVLLPFKIHQNTVFRGHSRGEEGVNWMSLDHAQSKLAPEGCQNHSDLERRWIGTNTLALTTAKVFAGLPLCVGQCCKTLRAKFIRCSPIFFHAVDSVNRDE